MAFLPGAGTTYPQAEVAGLRRIYLRKVACHIYYTFDEQEVIVRAFWGLVAAADLSPIPSFSRRRLMLLLVWRGRRRTTASLSPRGRRCAGHHAAGSRGNLRTVPVFLCRWPNGDCSVVLARSKADAVEKLDEVANAEGCPMVELSEAQVHFALNDDGQLVLDGLGEDTEQDIFEFCYPALGKALAVGKDVVQAVQQERDRGKDDRAEAEAPATELGRRTKVQLDMPTTLVNRMVSRAAKRRLRSFKPRGNPS